MHHVYPLDSIQACAVVEEQDKVEQPVDLKKTFS